jgi:hypothetical protein
MIWADIIIAILYVFVFIGGLRQGAIKSGFSLLALIISIPLTGLLFHFITGWFSFLNDANWANFLGFFITLAIISVILALIFLIPRKLLGAADVGFVSSIVGGLISIIGLSLALTLFVFVIKTYPVWDWLVQVLSGSHIVGILLNILGFTRFMLPEAFSAAASSIAIWVLLGV